MSGQLVCEWTRRFCRSNAHSVECRCPLCSPRLWFRDMVIGFPSGNGFTPFPTVSLPEHLTAVLSSTSPLDLIQNPSARLSDPSTCAGNVSTLATHSGRGACLVAFPMIAKNAIQALLPFAHPATPRTCAVLCVAICQQLRAGGAGRRAAACARHSPCPWAAERRRWRSSTEGRCRRACSRGEPTSSGSNPERRSPVG